MGILHVLTVGINRYRDPRIQDLACARQDAEAFGQLFADRMVKEDRKVQILLDEEATRANVLDAAGNELARAACEDDVVVMLFAGHGSPELDSAVDQVARYLILHDTDRARIFATAIDMEGELLRVIKRIKAGLVVIFLDTCFSGRAGGRTFEGPQLQASTHRTLSPDSRRLSDMALGKGRLLISSCGDDQVACEERSFGHGIFTHYLLEELRDHSRSQSTVGLGSLYERITEKVHSHTSGAQTPTMNGRAEWARLPLM